MKAANGAKAVDNRKRKAYKNRKGQAKKGKLSKKDPDKPRQPLGAFFLFIDEFRKTFKKKNPNVKAVSTIGKAGGEKWTSMSEAESVTDDGDGESARIISEVNDEDDEESGEKPTSVGPPTEEILESHSGTPSGTSQPASSKRYKMASRKRYKRAASGLCPEPDNSASSASSKEDSQEVPHAEASTSPSVNQNKSRAPEEWSPIRLDPSDSDTALFKIPAPKPLRSMPMVDLDFFFESLPKKTTPLVSETSGPAPKTQATPSFEEIETAKRSLKTVISLSFTDILHPGRLPSLTKALDTLVRAQAFGKTHQPALQLFHRDLPTLAQSYESFFREKSDVDRKFDRSSVLQAELGEVYEAYQKLKAKAEENDARQRGIEEQIALLQAQLVLVKERSVEIYLEKAELFRSSLPLHEEREVLDSALPALGAKRNQLMMKIEATLKIWSDFKIRFEGLL
ncbi:high mobility group B1 [Actinidia rufa]|uniref:High mobility group B1 n=1 Tax=Actinidia rufa TaxID=165716 RepID=A0A7J0F423_9ERIC|nr:high mobility group B1 [Actinidia rufa]